ncbi:hypothetical protein LWI29_022032 [Acer saccharum]|uniref:Pentatricopeptide repeat-containing protein n=1 Tax=Acer saccharum TaxID=4024 RepID=A0AA39S8J6_ACESA|nr:hypothetical protein LWI29_022032 [Acer saccharum]KAK1565515.1 hypothetical protein Q3G72_028428 [Acer saccharum]
MEFKTIVTCNQYFNALIVGDCAKEALQAFYNLERGYKPTMSTYVTLISGCAHCDLYAEGIALYERLHKDKTIIPSIKFYGVAINLHCKSGMFDCAFTLIETMRVKPNMVVWNTILSTSISAGRHDIVEVVIKNSLEEVNPHKRFEYGYDVSKILRGDEEL